MFWILGIAAVLLLVKRGNANTPPAASETVYRRPSISRAEPLLPHEEIAEIFLSTTSEPPPQTQSAYRVGQVFTHSGVTYEVIALGTGAILSIGDGYIAAGSTVATMAGKLYLAVGTSGAASLQEMSYTAPVDASGTPVGGSVIDPATGYQVGALSEAGIKLTGLEVYTNEWGARYYIDASGEHVYF